ncbi:MAG: hypothetical protein LBI53_06175 [Candidatus Peribacteria bacterium]|jgi:A/G-specific adenine glycosylase|nr:hypothetical protein [Candidatus Peribacteria bacterium]
MKDTGKDTRFEPVVYTCLACAAGILDSRIIPLQQKILTRYEKEGRDFPRRRTKDPYAIHICEVMSQSTQLSRVLPYWKRWMQDVPDYGTLAKISKAELLGHRSGL